MNAIDMVSISIKHIFYQENNIIAWVSYNVQYWGLLRGFENTALDAESSTHLKGYE